MVITQKSTSNNLTMPKTENNPPKITAEHLSEEVLATAEFVSLEKYSYKDHNGVERTWEVATRTTKPEPGNPDCVGSLAVLRRLLKYDCLILVKQYRPALKKYTLELPAGVVEPNEKPDETAIRELKEETGYICSGVKHISPLTALDAGLSNSTMKVVTLEVNGDIVENHHPKQCDHDCNIIEVLHIPVDELLTRLNEYSEQGIIIDSRVYCFAIGLTIGAKNFCYKPTANPY
ncbi:ADP-sugar pyrophosphatase-like isoform X2 [Argiope bruennichi]|uniref:ADP-sugar pyrophosphatase-like isoform X2 n=1 Tax=Argiope bruennichi TaxID=94029 RepID=UPI00249598AF|nr:ADP-sugar pyrophosphatase-like isoform X2 [Argiope bruennichi]